MQVTLPGYLIIVGPSEQQSGPKEIGRQNNRGSMGIKNKVWVLTIFMFWWRPSKILVSLKQTLNPCSSESSTHMAMLSCGLPGDCWMGVTSTTGGDRKRWNDNGKSKPLKIDKRKKQMAKKSNILVDCDLFRDSGIHIANLKVNNSRAPY